MNTKPVKNFEGLYTVSDDGRVFSVERKVNVNGHGKQKTKTIKGKELSIQTDTKGYSFVVLSKGGVSKSYRVHRILMESETAEGHLNGESMDKDSQIALFQGLARAFYWQRLLDAGEVRSGSEIAQLEELDPSTVNELLRLTLLDPSLIMDILEGRQSQQVSMMWFTRNALPDLWHEQFTPQQTI